jgi:hypothetical protein
MSNTSKFQYFGCDDMTEHFKEKRITLEKENMYLCYTLNDSTKFNDVSFKIMKSSDLEELIQCVKITYNGKPKLIYNPENLRPLSEILTASSADNLWVVVTEILDGIIKIKNNGFLVCENLDYSPDCIFWDPNRGKPHFIYLPLASTETSASYAKFEHEFRMKLIEGIQQSSSVLFERKRFIMELLATSAGDVEELSRTFSQHCKQKIKEKDELASQDNQLAYKREVKEMCLVNNASHIRLKIDRDKFSIGRASDNVKVLKLSNTISRHHCIIYRDNFKHYIEDVGSRFGTFVNNKQCIPNERYPIEKGDVVKFASLEFIVEEQ